MAQAPIHEPIAIKSEAVLKVSPLSFAEKLNLTHLNDAIPKRLSEEHSIVPKIAPPYVGQILHGRGLR